jgi:hypothetical protein
MKTTLFKKIIQYRIQWEMKNGYPVPDTNKAMINVTKELRDPHKNTFKENI